MSADQTAPQKLTISHFVMALLACTILVPRLANPRFSASVLNPDDIIPLVAAGVGALVVLRTAQLPRTAAIPLLIVWSLMGFLTALQGADTLAHFGRSVAKGLLRPINMLLIIVFVHNWTLGHPDRLWFAVRWVVRAGTLIGLMAVVVYTVALLTGQVLPGIDQLARDNAAARSVPGRFIGTVDIANFAGAFFLLLIPATMSAAMMAQTRRERLFYIASIGMQLFGLVATFTRASLIFLILAVLGMIILLRLWHLLRMFMIAGAILLAIVFIILPEYITRFTQDDTDRMVLWSVGVKVMSDHPILGVGPGNYMTTITSNPVRYPARANPHNMFIMLGAENGVIVMLVGLGLAVFTTWEMFQAYLRCRGARERIMIVGMFAGVVGFWMQNVTNDLLILPKISTYFWLHYILTLNLSYSHQWVAVPEPQPETQLATLSA